MSADLPVEMLRRAVTPMGPKNGEICHPVVIRMPPEVIRHIDVCAAANGRTRSSEIRVRLEASMANESVNEHGVIVVQAPSSLK